MLQLWRRSAERQWRAVVTARAGVVGDAGAGVPCLYQRRRLFRVEPREYERLHRASTSEAGREAFWAEAALELDWAAPFRSVLDARDASFARWFPDGQINMCRNAVDRWVEAGHGARVAIQYDSPATGVKRAITYEELQDEVALFAGALAARGVVKGDRVVIYMPMIPEAVIAMLGCARIGAVHSVVFGGFAARELATRIDDATPRVVVSASCGVEPKGVVPYDEMLDGALAMAKHKPSHVIVKHRTEIKSAQNRVPKTSHEEWEAVLDAAEPHACVPVLSVDPLYILYTSGTTGQPKGVVRDTGGYATALKYAMRVVFGLEEGDVMWSASDLGWVVGHSFICYGPLLHGCTTVLFEGKPIVPDAGVFWRVAAEHKVNAMFTAPTAARAIRKKDPTLALAKQHDLSALRAVFLAGERADPSTVEFLAHGLRKPIVDNFWQTELGWPCLAMQTHGTRPGSAGRPVPGWDLHVLDEESSRELGPDKLGDVCIKTPLPPGAMLTLHKADQRCRETYFTKHPGFYTCGDAGFKDSDADGGYFHIMARTDDVINTAGHRLSSGAIEEVIARHPDVAECAVVGPHDADKGNVPVAFLVLRDGARATPEQVEQRVVEMVRQDIGAIAAFRSAFAVAALPKTRSGKILRGVMLKMCDGLPYAVPGTVEDLTAVEHVERVIKQRWSPARSAA